MPATERTMRIQAVDIHEFEGRSPVPGTQMIG